MIITFQERVRECTVDQVVGQQHFAEQNIDNSVDVVTSPREVGKWQRTWTNLSDEEFAQALVPLNSAISQSNEWLSVLSRARTRRETLPA